MIDFAANRLVEWVLRALQLVFAVVVMGLGGQAIHEYRGHTVENHFAFGDYVDYEGVPSAWGFLMYCAVWTVIVVIFNLVCGAMAPHRGWVGHVRIGTEAVAILSWFAGWIAVAVNVGTNTCPSEEDGCGSIKAATVFGAFEWLLFVATAVLIIKLVFGAQQLRSSMV